MTETGKMQEKITVFKTGQKIIVQLVTTASLTVFVNVNSDLLFDEGKNHLLESSTKNVCADVLPSSVILFVSDEDQEVLKECLSQNGYASAISIIKEIHDFGISQQPEISTTTDGGVVIVYEDSVANRELTFIVPNDGSRKYFVARNIEGEYIQTGAVAHSIAFSGFTRWLSGAIEILPTDGLTLPKQMA